MIVGWKFRYIFQNPSTNTRKSSRIPSGQLFGDIKLGLQNGLRPIQIIDLPGNEIITKSSFDQKNHTGEFVNTLLIIQRIGAKTISSPKQTDFPVQPAWHGEE